MYQNLLLASLRSDQLARLKPQMVAQRMSAQQILRKEGDRASDVYFIESGLVSLISGAESEQLETTLVGREGMIGACVLLGEAASPSTALVRVGGLAWRIARRDLLGLVETDPELGRHLLGYVHTRMLGAARAIISAGRCTIQQRVAGWLLMAHDRLDADEMPLTHDCLAAALGVRRPGVTVAMHILEGEHSIKARRGRIEIRSRDVLEKHAGSAYRRPDRRFENLAAAAG